MKYRIGVYLHIDEKLTRKQLEELSILCAQALNFNINVHEVKENLKGSMYFDVKESKYEADNNVLLELLAEATRVL